MTEIVIRNLTKQYKQLRAVDDLSFAVRAGRVTGFLGPNGAGKTTTLRMLLSLVTPTSGTATIGGRRYADLDQPIRHVGAVLEASSAHKGRTGRNHLRIICAAAGLKIEQIWTDDQNWFTVNLLSSVYTNDGVWRHAAQNVLPSHSMDGAGGPGASQEFRYH